MGGGAEPAAASCDLVGTEGPAFGSAVHCLPNQLEPRRRGVRHGPLLFAVPPLLKTLLWTLSVLDFVDIDKGTMGKLAGVGVGEGLISSL